MEPSDVASLVDFLRFQVRPRHTVLYLHVALPDRGVAVDGQSLPNLPGSARAVFATTRKTSEPPVRADLVKEVETPWVLDSGQTIKFHVVKDTGLSLK